MEENPAPASGHAGWFSFYGGPRDYLVTTPSVRDPNEVHFVTSEMNNLFASIDHNGQLFSLDYLNALVPVVG